MRFLQSKLALIPLALGSLSACGLTPTQQKWAGVAASVLVVGAIAAHREDSGKPVNAAVMDSTLPCHPQPDGSCR
jgi:hypothetical protein